MHWRAILNTIKRWHRECSLLAALCCVSCGPGLLEGEELVDTDDPFLSDNIVVISSFPHDTEEKFEVCPTNEEVLCSYEYFSNQGIHPAITASWISTSAVFTHFSQNLILGMDGCDDEPSLFAIRVNVDEVQSATDFNYVSAIGRFTTDIDSPLAWVGGVTESNGFWNSGFQYMAAAATSDGFILAGIPRYVGEHTLTALENSALVIDANIAGLVYLQNRSELPSSELEKICLFGDGLFCFDGNEWTTEIAPGQGFLINEVGVSTIDSRPMLLAIGETAQMHCKWDGEWSIIPLDEIDAPLIDISVNTVSQYFAAAGDQFLLHGAVGRTLHRCDIPPHILRFNYYHDTSKFAILATDGQLWAGELDTFQNGIICKTRHLIEGAIDAMPGGHNFYVLHPEAVYSSQNYNDLVPE